MIEITQNITVQGISRVNDKDVMILVATVPEDGGVSISKTILNNEEYLGNLELCDTDYKQFEDYVNALIKSDISTNKEV